VYLRVLNTKKVFHAQNNDILSVNANNENNDKNNKYYKTIDDPIYSGH